jgi:hypothetical protein
MVRSTSDVGRELLSAELQENRMDERTTNIMMKRLFVTIKTFLNLILKQNIKNFPSNHQPNQHQLDQCNK